MKTALKSLLSGIVLLAGIFEAIGGAPRILQRHDIDAGLSANTALGLRQDDCGNGVEA